ncbi:unnamed protein product, partial [Ectocarpus sp. 8 AP-2014]
MYYFFHPADFRMHTPTLSISPRTIYTSRPPNVRRRSAFERARPRKRERSFFGKKKEEKTRKHRRLQKASHAKVQLFASKARVVSGHDMGHHCHVRPSICESNPDKHRYKNYCYKTTPHSQAREHSPPHPILPRLDKQTAAAQRDTPPSYLFTRVLRAV